MVRWNRVVDALVVSYVLHSLVQPAPTQPLSKHTMKASIVILALIQGLALAAPGRPKYREALKQLMDDPITRPWNSEMLDTEQREASGSPAELEEMARAYQQRVLPRECFEADKQIKPFCEHRYRFCVGGYLSGPDFVGTWKSGAKFEGFEQCVKTQLQQWLATEQVNS